MKHWVDWQEPVAYWASVSEVSDVSVLHRHRAGGIRHIGHHFAIDVEFHNVIHICSKLSELTLEMSSLVWICCNLECWRVRKFRKSLKKIKFIHHNTKNIITISFKFKWNITEAGQN